MSISNEIKNKAIFLYCNTNLRVSNIIKKLAPNGEMNIEEFYSILSEYEQEKGEKLRRPNKKNCIRIEDLEFQDVDYTKSLSEIVYQLREQGMSYRKMESTLRENGIICNFYKLKEICEDIYRKLGKEIPESKYDRNKKIGNISDDEIYNLRSKSLSYKEISELLKDRGIDVSAATIRNQCKRYFEKIHEEDTYAGKRKTKYDYSEIKKLYGDEIFNLREKSYTYKQIRECIKEKGYDISEKKLADICKEVYADKGVAYKKLDYRKFNYKRIPADIPKDMVLKLRLKGYSYEYISGYLFNKGIETSHNTLEKICKQMFEELGMKDSKKSSKRAKLTDLVNDEIGMLIDKGFSFNEIKEQIENKGIEISKDNFEKKYSKICKKKGIEAINNSDDINLKDVDPEKVKKALLNLKRLKNASNEELKKILESYNLDIDIEEHER